MENRGAPMSDVTELLNRWSKGDEKALDALVPLVYRELRQLAAYHLKRERTDHTLQPTALVNEAYMRLARESSNNFTNRHHFMGAAANVMRRVLVDHSRRRKAVKRGSGTPELDLDRALEAGVDTRIDLLALDQALTRLGERLPAPARVVELRYFGGLSIGETATVLGVAPATVSRHWAFARVWLYRELAGPRGEPSDGGRAR
jgi:RNA polymerase sigma factor (TIGR02999 family)